MPPSLTWPKASTGASWVICMPMSGAFAPSATTRMLKVLPCSCRALIRSHTSSMLKGTSGTRMMSAPPARPPTAATHPAGAEPVQDPLRPALDLERVRPRRPQNGAAPMQDPPDVLGRQFDDIVVEQPQPAVADADDLVALSPPGAGHRPDRRVESRRVSAAGENPDPHV